MSSTDNSLQELAENLLLALTDVSTAFIALTAGVAEAATENTGGELAQVLQKIYASQMDMVELADKLEEAKPEEVEEEPERITEKDHAINPVPGDYWHEHFHPILVVLEVTKSNVIVCKTAKDAGPDSWEWDMSKIEVLSRKYFSTFLSYKNIPGYYANVASKSHSEIVSVYEEMK